MSKPTLAIAGLTACFGCQLTLLNCEEELLTLAERFEFTYFPMGSSRHNIASEFSAALVEGAVSTPADLETLVKLRSRSKFLIAFGTCALWGGVAAMNNHLPRTSLAEVVYGKDAVPDITFNPGPLDRFVTVDFAIIGCPPEKGELLATLAALLHDTLPVFPQYPVCTECRNRENVCLLIEKGEPCLGPITQAGCNARCPAVSIKCEGCRGPVTEANVASEIDVLMEKGISRDELVSRMRRFYPEWDYGQRS